MCDHKERRLHRVNGQRKEQERQLGEKAQKIKVYVLASEGEDQRCGQNNALEEVQEVKERGVVPTRWQYAHEELLDLQILSTR